MYPSRARVDTRGQGSGVRVRGQANAIADAAIVPDRGLDFLPQPSKIPRSHHTTGNAMIKGIKFANVPVSDQDRAIAFYTEKLGFILATDQPFDGKQRWVEMRIPGADTRVVLFTPDGWEERIG